FGGAGAQARGKFSGLYQVGRMPGVGGGLGYCKRNEGGEYRGKLESHATSVGAIGAARKQKSRRRGAGGSDR
ncbi:MAG TPA: hypothetical protein VHA11_01240, partial [Bryobacteraceae bacterium]|nr:hypothetical protein [Bryobacteraceae bacterium]